MGTDANTLHDLMLGDRLVDELDTPAVLVDLDLLERNIARMAAFAREHGVQLRPHAKSHKTLQIAERQRTAGSSGLTVAKLDEAEAFLDHGFDDLFVANEVVGMDKWQRLVTLQERGRVAAGIDSPEAADGLDRVANASGARVPVLIEVDSGLGRAGVQPGDAALHLAQHVSNLGNLTLRGVFTHAGHAYGATSAEEVARGDRQRRGIAQHWSSHAHRAQSCMYRRQSCRPSCWRAGRASLRGHASAGQRRRTMSRVGCAVIGSGFAGSTFAEAVRYASDAELVGIARLAAVAIVEAARAAVSGAWEEVEQP